MRKIDELNPIAARYFSAAKAHRGTQVRDSDGQAHVYVFPRCLLRRRERGKAVADWRRMRQGS